jgi:excinuclease ABC subunit C
MQSGSSKDFQVSESPPPYGSDLDRWLAGRIALAPRQPGCYLWKGEAGEVLYVGKAVRLRDRLRNYLNPDDPRRIVLMQRVRDLEWITTDTATEALILEDTLIKKYSPRYNVRLKDDKRYPFLCVSLSEPYPRIYMTRKMRDDGNRYFGPYTDVRSARQILDLIHRTFPIRKVRQTLPLKRPRRPCMNYHIKRCLAPCQGNVPQEEYDRIVQEILLFLEGRHELLEERVQRRMEEYSSRMEFEKAAVYRDLLISLRSFSEKQNVVRPGTGDEDVVAVCLSDDEVMQDHAQAVVLEFRSGRMIARKSYALQVAPGMPETEAQASFLREYYLNCRQPPARIIIASDFEGRKELETLLKERTGSDVRFVVPAGASRTTLELARKNAALLLQERLTGLHHQDRSKGLKEIARMLGLPAPPAVMECYDISHFGGRETVASGVRFENGLPRPAAYRRYIIRSVDGIDDPASMKEVIARRLQRLSNEGRPYPDLIVIDGGHTQLSSAREAAEALGASHVPMIGLAKQREEVYLPGNPVPLTPDKNSAGMRILRQMRDEAHRFAITYQRKRRNQAALKHSVESIPDIGAARKQALLKHLKNKKIEEASFEDLIAVPGIGRELAERIVRHFAEKRNR